MTLCLFQRYPMLPRSGGVRERGLAGNCITERAGGFIRTVKHPVVVKVGKGLELTIGPAVDFAAVFPRERDPDEPGDDSE